jgi:hypothetical protein
MARQYFRLGSLYVLIFLSGLAGLGYEMVWSRMLTTGLGHEVTAVLARRLYPLDPYQSRSLLLDLEQANPVRDDARSLRENLFP